MPYKDFERDNALHRALKMSKLFKAGVFDDIVDAINQPLNKPKFDAACNKAKLDDKEKAWLWNYLKECGNYWKDVPEAAGTGW